MTDELKRQDKYSLSEVLEVLRDLPTKTIWHYTTAEGLLGILQSGSLWASSVRLLNDMSEVSFLAHRVISAINAREDDPDGKALQVVISSIREQQSKLCVASFCAVDDLLSQWRGYAGAGGYAIGFDVEALFEHVSSRKQAMLTPVLYGGKGSLSSQELLAEELVAAWKQKFPGGVVNFFESRGKPAGSKTDKDDEESLAKELFSMQRVFNNVSHAMIINKDPAWNEEQEWRLISRDNSVNPLKYRAVAGQVVSYQELSVQDSSSTSPIRKIRCGPGVQFAEQQEVVLGLLDSLGYEGVSVEASRIPLRAYSRP